MSIADGSRGTSIMTDDQDESVNGGRLAAQILNHMEPGNRQRILRAIREKDPQAFQRIEGGLFTFNDIPTITAAGLQRLIKEIDHNDLVLALKMADEAIKQSLFDNMSERKLSIVLDDLDMTGATPQAEVLAAQQRILTIIDKLREAGTIRTASDDDLWV